MIFVARLVCHAFFAGFFFLLRYSDCLMFFLLFISCVLHLSNIERSCYDGFRDFCVPAQSVLQIRSFHLQFSFQMFF